MNQSQQPMAREKLFNMRMNDEEWERVARVATHYGLNAASLFRMLVKKEDDTLTALDPAHRELLGRLFGAAHPPPLKGLAEVLGRTVQWTREALSTMESRGFVQKWQGGFTLTPAGEAKWKLR